MAVHLDNPSAHIEAVIDVALCAGTLVTSIREKGLQDVRRKSSAIDLQTEADVAAEKLIREELGALDSSLGFWGEESNKKPEETAFWIVDPIDGTNNFTMGLPLYAVNIALQDGPQTVVGVTVELPSRRVYWAAVGEGAYLRSADGSQQRLHVNQAGTLESAFLSTGFPYHRTEHADNNGAEHLHFLSRAQGIRCLGASAIELAYVAAGMLGGYWEGWLNPWDVAPGALLVREAGGRITNYEGDEWALDDRSVIATNGQAQVHQSLIAGIRTVRSQLTETRI
jgi:myo-inositol-1(or 4)-monophosphatase